MESKKIGINANMLVELIMEIYDKRVRDFLIETLNENVQKWREANSINRIR